MNPLHLGLLSLLLVPGSVLAAAAGFGHAPTRLQLCQQEVQGATGEERKRQLRDCLTRRVEGEAGVAADCRRQLGIGTKRSAAQQRQLRDCEVRALAVPSHRLPRRPPPPPAPAPLPPQQPPLGAGPAPLRGTAPPPRPAAPLAPLRGSVREGA